MVDEELNGDIVVFSDAEIESGSCSLCPPFLWRQLDHNDAILAAVGKLAAFGSALTTHLVFVTLLEVVAVDLEVVAVEAEPVEGKTKLVFFFLEPELSAVSAGRLLPTLGAFLADLCAVVFLLSPVAPAKLRLATEAAEDEDTDDAGEAELFPSETRMFAAFKALFSQPGLCACAFPVWQTEHSLFLHKLLFPWTPTHSCMPPFLSTIGCSVQMQSPCLRSW